MAEKQQRWDGMEKPQEVKETLFEYFIKFFPDIEIDEDGTPKYICPYFLGFEKDYAACNENDCMRCWNRPRRERKQE